MLDPPSVFVVEDDPYCYLALRRRMQTQGYSVLTFTSAEEFLGAHRRNCAGCLVLDLDLPGMNGLKLQEELIERAICLPVIMVTTPENVTAGFQGLQRGAKACLTKPIQREELVSRVFAAIEWDKKNRQREATIKTLSDRLATLSPRERQVLELIVAGKTIKQIASQCGVSQSTIKTQRRIVLDKMHVRCDADLIRQISWLWYTAELHPAPVL